jgi:hypothetical protein
LVVVVNIGVVYDALVYNSVVDVWSAYHLKTGLVTLGAVADSEAVSPEHIVVPFAVMLVAVAGGFIVIVTGVRFDSHPADRAADT